MQVIIGTKIGMTQIIGDDGIVTPVTILLADPSTVTQIKTVESDGYNAVQLGYGQGKNLSKSVAGHVKTAGVTPKVLREFRTADAPELKVGDTVSVAKSRSLAPPKARVSLAPSNVGTSTNRAIRTASKATFAASDPSDRCIPKKFSKARRCQAAWATIR